MEGMSEQATVRVKLRWSRCVVPQMLALTSSRATPQGTTDGRSDIETNQTHSHLFLRTHTHTHAHTSCVTCLKMPLVSVDQTFVSTSLSSAYRIKSSYKYNTENANC